MLHVGLTGGIGSGKSSVADMFGDLGAVVLDADRIVRDLLSQGGRAAGPVAEAFGADVLEPSGSVNRKTLAAVVFNDPGARRRLEAILHPLVLAERRRMLLEIEREKGTGAIVVTEASLIFEAHTVAEFDAVILVTAPEPVRKARLMDAGWDAGEVERRMAAQWPDSAKAPLADYVIDNGGSSSDARARVEALWQQLKERSRAAR
jgi:dephospho-CoA kinase